jgi:hypothetical protein
MRKLDAKTKPGDGKAQICTLRTRCAVEVLPAAANMRKAQTR